jgi:hypothetical protein
MTDLYFKLEAGRWFANSLSERGDAWLDSHDGCDLPGPTARDEMEQARAIAIADGLVVDTITSH